MTRNAGSKDSKFSPLRRLRKKEAEIDEELAFHLEMEEAKLRSQGLDEKQARREARLRFGGQEKWRHEVRDVDGIGPFERLKADLAFGFRMLRRSPMFTIVAVLTLALGIGASTAIFSIVDGILLRPLTYADSSELVTVWADYTRRDGPAREWWGYPNYYDLREATAEAAKESATSEPPGTRVFEDIAFWNNWNPTLTGTGDSALALQGVMISHGMLSRVLRVTPVAGSSFSAEDDVPNAPRTVMISERLWQEKFGSDPELIGTSLMLNGDPYTLLGVLPASFRQPLLPNSDIWTLVQWDATNFQGGRGSARFRVLGRLAEGVELETARARATQIATNLEREYPEDLTGVGMAVFPLKEDIVAGPKNGLLLLLAAVVATLLIVCINLANLLLARGSSRKREFSLRAALGASAGRLVRQLLTESLLLSVLGGMLGVGLAVLGTRLLVYLAPAGTPRIEEVAVDLRVLLFCAGVSLLCGLIFGLLPALQAVKSRLSGRIGRNLSGTERASEVLVATQVAAALVLLIGAGLLLQSFSRLANTDLGFEPEGVVTASVFAAPARFPEIEQATQYLDDAQAELASVPGVESVTRIDSFPLAGFNGDLNYTIEGRPEAAAGEERIAWLRRTTPGYFSSMEIELLHGRDFEPTDDAQAVVVTIVNEALAKKEFGNENPVGKRLNVNSSENPRWREIVGVVSDVKNFGLRGEPRPALYLPYAQARTRQAFFVLKTSGDPDRLQASAKSRLSSFDPEAAPVLTIAETFVTGARSLDRFVTWLLSLFAAVALILAAVGLYGVISYRVTRRTKEIGLRLALGAPARAVGRSVVGRSLVIALIGIAIGIAAATLATKGLRSLLFEVAPSDPVTFVALAILMVIVACLASAFPAWRASRMDPAGVLKQD